MIWILGILTGLYFFPLIKCVYLLVRRVLFLPPQIFKATARKISLYSRILFIGAQIEYHLDPLRRILVTPILVFATFLVSAFFIAGFIEIPMVLLVWLFGLAVVSVLQELIRYQADIKMLELIRTQPRIHPQECFRRYKFELCYGGTNLLLFDQVPTVSPENADFRKGGRAKFSYLISIKSLIDTIYVAHFAIFAFRHLGADYGNLVFDKIGSLWGKRLLQHAEGRFSVTGLDHLSNRKGRFLFVFNHKSSMDFILSFFAFSSVVFDERAARIRFIVAEDHFKSNKIVYSFFGIGRAIDLAGMIFISRKNREKSFDDLRQAATAMIQNHVDVAIYPQGTRAAANVDRAQKRRDAGYYTTLSKHNHNGAKPHLKRGTAYLIFNTLTVMREQNLSEHLNVVFVGIKGAATTMPKNVYKIQTETDIEFTVGDVVSFNPAVIDELTGEGQHAEHVDRRREFINAMHDLIDEKLVDVLGLHSTLRLRYLTELKGQFRLDQEKIDLIEQGLDRVARSTSVVYEILDRIYTLPLNQWNGFLSQLNQFLLEQCSLQRMIDFRDELSEELIKIS